MPEVYETIDALLERRGITGARMCVDLGFSRSFMTELRKGRAKSLKVDTAQKIADYFNVPIEYLLTGTDPQLEVNGTAGEPKPLSIEARANQILSGLSDGKSDTLMLDGKPASPEAVEAFKNAVMVGIEMARRVNEQKKDSKENED